MATPASFLTHPLYNSSLKTLIPFVRCLGPGFCSNGSGVSCGNTTFYDCTTCSKPGAIIFIVVAILILIIIVVGNLGIMWLIVRGGKEMRNDMNYIRLSMCVSDFTVGAVLGVALIPNAFMTLRTTAVDLAVIKAQSSNTPTSLAFGVLFTLGYTSSMYHLLLLGLYRLVAINWPIWYRVHGIKHLWILILVIWAISVISASMLALVSKNVRCIYYEPNFIYLPTLRFEDPSSIYKAPPLAAFVISAFCIPYVSVTVVLVVTSVQVYRRTKKSKKISHSKNDKLFLKRERDVVQTIVIMFTTFSIAICPLTVCFFHIYGKPPTQICYIAIPLMVCTLLAMSNSAVNVIVYGMREAKFRNILHAEIERITRRIEETQLIRS